MLCDDPPNFVHIPAHDQIRLLSLHHPNDIDEVNNLFQRISYFALALAQSHPNLTRRRLEVSRPARILPADVPYRFHIRHNPIPPGCNSPQDLRYPSWGNDYSWILCPLFFAASNNGRHNTHFCPPPFLSRQWNAWVDDYHTEFSNHGITYDSLNHCCDDPPYYNHLPPTHQLFLLNLAHHRAKNILAIADQIRNTHDPIPPEHIFTTYEVFNTGWAPSLFDYMMWYPTTYFEFFYETL